MIRLESLTKRYGSTLAVDNLSFELRPGKITGFLGPNGSGKSTTMRCIVGLDQPSSGRATIGGVEYKNLSSPLTTVGALLDGKAFHPSRTARQHLRSVALTHGFPKSRVDEVLELTGLTHVAGRKLKGFSLGMGQRVGIATALLGDPEVLLFDEPVNGLDPEGVRWVRSLMRDLANEGRTILVSSHLMSEMALSADDLVVIGRGRLIATGPIESFTQTNANTTVKVAGPDLAAIEAALSAANIYYQRAGEPGSEASGGVVVRGNDAGTIGHILYEARVEIHELSTSYRSLEDVFMDMTGSSVEYRAGAPAPQFRGYQPGTYPNPNDFPGFGGTR